MEMGDISPTLAQVQKLTLDGNLVAISVERPTGEETPTDAFLKVRRGGTSFLFELSEKDDPVVLRHSIIATEPYRTLATGPGFQADRILGRPRGPVGARHQFGRCKLTRYK